MSISVADAMQIAMASSRGVKEACVSTAADYSETIMATGLQVYRGADPVALVVMQPDEEAMLEIAAVCASGFGADVITLVFEGHYSFLTENPETQQPWMSGELQRAIEKSAAGVSSAIVVHATNRAGDNAVSMLPYEVNGDTVTWSEPVKSLPDAPPGSTRFGGELSDAMSNIMLEDTPLQVKFQRSGMTPFHEVFGDPPETEVDHLDCVTVRYLWMVDDVISAALYAAPNSPRSEVINKVLPKSD